MTVPRIVDGRYIVEGNLGSGGMGVVLRARHQYTGVAVALKMLRADFQLDPAVQERFLAEARAPSAIGHPGIVQVMDAGRTAEGELYLAMELLEGVPLRAVVRSALPHAEIRRIVLELLDALAAAHARGVVHRDLKPENVFLAGPARTVKLLDFGIAKIVQADAGAQFKTAAGAILGTLAYMAPEQLRDASAVDPRADLWAVGVMIYEMLCGRLPHRETDLHALYAAVLTRPPEPITNHVPHMPAPFVALLARALAVDPAQRFQSAAELGAAVAALPVDSVIPRATAAPSPIVDATAATAATGSPAWAPSTPPPPSASAVPPPAASASSVPSGWSPAPGGAAAHVHGSSVPASPLPGGAAPPVHGSSVPSWSPAPGGAAPPVHGSSVPASPLPGGAAPPVHGSSVPRADVPTTASTGWSASAPSPAGTTAAANARSRWPIAAVAIAAIVGVVVVALVATRRDPSPPAPTIASGSGSGSGSGSAIVTKTVDAKVDPWAQQSASATGAECIRGCDALATCGFAYNACTSDCATRAGFAECFAISDCNQRAVCIFGKNCAGVEPSGTTDCRTALACQAICDDGLCICSCAARMSPTYALALMRVDACASNCNMDRTCVDQTCVGVAAACAGNATN